MIKRRRIPGVLLFLLCWGVAVAAEARPAEEILERARIAATLQYNDLKGHLRTGRQKTELRLFLRGENIQFQYLPDRTAWKIFHMRLGDGQYDLFEGKGDQLGARFPAKRLRESVAGSELTFEDLSMRFFYWPNPVLEGEERVGTQQCWKIRLDNPGREGNYRVIYVWVHKKFGAFMKIEGFDAGGRLLRRFEVDSTMKLDDGSYTLKKMSVSSFRGERGKERKRGISHVEFEKPTKAPRGPR